MENEEGFRDILVLLAHILQMRKQPEVAMLNQLDCDFKSLWKELSHIFKKILLIGEVVQNLSASVK